MDKVIATNTVNMKGNTLNTGKKTTVVTSLLVETSNTRLPFRTSNLNKEKLQKRRLH
jgi:hypothetical protein